MTKLLKRYKAVVHGALTIELSLFNHVHRFNAGDEFGGTMKFFESQHGSRSALNGSVVLFHKIVQIFRLAQRDFQAAVGDQAVHCRSISAALVDDNFLRHIRK